MDAMPSSLPSSFGGPQVPSQNVPPARSAPSQPVMQAAPSSNLPLILAGVALALSLLSVYGTFFMDHPLSGNQRAALLGIASDLRSLQQRDITMTAPVQTTVVLNSTYPLAEMFPSTFTIPLQFDLPIDTQLLAIGPNGEPFSAHVQDTVPITVSVPISSAQAFGNSTLTLNKELPVNVQFTSSVKIGDTYKAELDGVISKVEALAGGQNGSG